MSQQLRSEYATAADWDAAYRDGTPPWDAGRPHAELPRVLEEYNLRPQTVLEVGCGSGADAILMALRRFEFAQKGGQFDLVYDAGLYHYVRENSLPSYLEMLWRATRPGSHFLCLAGAPSEREDNDGPPQVDEDDIRNELGRLFEFVHLRPIRLESSAPNRRHHAWSCLMRR